MNRIICVGNPFLLEDMAGRLVYERLSQMVLPDGVEVIDGGLGGLNLLPFLDGADRVVFVDAVKGFGSPGEVVAIDSARMDLAASRCFDHAAGLGYLCSILPAVCEQRVPHITLVGVEGYPTERSIAEATAMALEVSAGMPGPIPYD